MDSFIEKIASRRKGRAAPEEEDEGGDEKTEKSGGDEAAHDLLAAISEYMQTSCYGPSEKDPAVQKIRAKQKAQLCKIVTETIRDIAGKK